METHDSPPPRRLAEKLTSAAGIAADHPLLPAVRAELEQRLVQSAAAGAVRPLDNADDLPPARRPWWTRPGPLLLLALLAIAALSYGTGLEIGDRLPRWSRLDPDDALPERMLPGEVDANAPLNPYAKAPSWDRLVLDTHLRQLCEAEPSAPLYEFYALYHRAGGWGELPAGYDAMTQRLDPGNGIWPLLRADSITVRTLSPGGSATVHTELPQEIVSSTREAMAAPRFAHHWSEFEDLCRARLHPRTYAAAKEMTWYLRDVLEMGYGYPFDTLYGVSRNHSLSPELLRSYIWTVAPMLGREALDGQSLRLYELDGSDLMNQAGLDLEARRFTELYHLQETEHPPYPPSAPGLWEFLSQIRGHAYHDSFGWMPVHALVETRLALLSSGWVLLLVCITLALRLIPRPAMAALLERCVLPLAMPKRRWTVGFPLLTLALLAAAGREAARTRFDFETDLINLIPTALLACLAALLAALQIVRHFVSRRTAGVGLSHRSRWALLDGYGMLVIAIAALALWTRYGYYPTQEGFYGPAASGAVLLWVLAKIGLGYAGHRSSVRHRLIARLLLPVVLLLTAAFGLGALATRPVESHLVDEVFHRPAPHYQVTGKSRADIEEWISRWQVKE